MTKRGVEQNLFSEEEQSPPELVSIYLKLPPEHIVTLLFLLESYDGLGIIRTLDRDRGYVLVLAPTDTAPVVKELLESLRQELQFETIPCPLNCGVLGQDEAVGAHGNSAGENIPSENNDWLLNDPDFRRLM